MELDISWVAVVVAILVGMAIAWVWYSDWGLVGGTWRKLTGVTKADSDKGGTRPFAILVVSIIMTAIVLAAACAVASQYFDINSLWLAMAVGLVAWAGFSLSTLAQHNGFEQKPGRLTAINGAYQGALFLGMAIPIGILQ